MSIFLRTTAILMALLSTQAVQAYCPRCAAIEAAREEEQVKHPQDAGYYDDYQQNQAQETKNPNKGP